MSSDGYSRLPANASKVSDGMPRFLKQRKGLKMSVTSGKSPRGWTIVRHNAYKNRINVSRTDTVVSYHMCGKTIRELRLYEIGRRGARIAVF